MFRKRLVCLVMALVCLPSLTGVALAAEVDCDATYCFSPADFSEDEEENLMGICITGLPEAAAGTVMLGSRILRPGDILTVEQVAQMTFSPLRTEEDQDAVVTYLPIYEDRVEKTATMTISIRGKEDKPPVAEDSSLETYKNLPNEGQLKVTEPEGQSMTYTVIRQPKRGDVIIREDGSFLYTPRKNKVGIDSFTYTATDETGHVSREARVTIQILKPTDSTQYADTTFSDCRFAAEWMKNTGLFVGEQINGERCFQPEKTVTRGEFLAMMVNMLEIPVEEDAAYTGYTDDAPTWLRPYLAAAMRSGLTAGWPDSGTGQFHAEQPITGAEAAVMLQNALDLSYTASTDEPVSVEDEENAVAAWAVNAVEALSQNGVSIDPAATLTRGQVANILYQVSTISDNAPGMSVFRKQ